MSFPARNGSACLMMLVSPVGEASRQTKFELPPVRRVMPVKYISLETRYSFSSSVVVIAIFFVSVPNFGWKEVGRHSVQNKAKIT